MRVAGQQVSWAVACVKYTVVIIYVSSVAVSSGFSSALWHQAVEYVVSAKSACSLVSIIITRDIHVAIDMCMAIGVLHLWGY